VNRVVTRFNAFPESAVFLAVFAWSFGPIFMNAVDVSVNSLIFYRAIFWPPVLYVIMRARKISVTKSAMKISFVPGLFFGLSTIVGFTSLRTTSIANATIIGSVSTALVLFVAPRFFNESINRKQVFFALLSFAGVAVVAFGAGSLRDAVLILSLVIGVGTTGHTLLVWAQGHVEATTSSLICLLVPVGSMIAAWIFFRQGVTIMQLFGAAVVLASLAAVLRYSTAGTTKRASLIVVDPLIN